MQCWYTLELDPIMDAPWSKPHSRCESVVIGTAVELRNDDDMLELLVVLALQGTTTGARAGCLYASCQTC